jgi:hypothetical protein
MPFDFEHKAKKLMAKQRQLLVGIVGFGKFGQFLAQRLVQAGHQVCCLPCCCIPIHVRESHSEAWRARTQPLLQVLATSRGDYGALAAGMGVKYFGDANDFCEEHPDVVVFATSILSLEGVVSALPVQRLRRSTLFVDVLSVKAFPKRLMLSLLPPEVGPAPSFSVWHTMPCMHCTCMHCTLHASDASFLNMHAGRWSDAPAHGLPTRLKLVTQPGLIVQYLQQHYNAHAWLLPGRRWTSCARTPCLAPTAAPAAGRA